MSTVLNESSAGNDPFGMSRFSIRRYSVQHLLLIGLAIGLLVSLTVVASRHGYVPLIALSAATLAVVLVKTVLVIWVGIRTVAVEIWIRRLGMGDLEYRIEPRGNDEVTKACQALEALRQNSIRAMQLDLVTQLSAELKERNGELEQALADLRESQDRIISQQKLAELGELASGVAHEMRNPLQFVRNFTSLSQELAADLLELLEQPGEVSRRQAEGLIRDLTGNLERVEHHSDRLNSIASAMMIYDRRTGGGFQPVELNQLIVEQTNLGYQAIRVYEPDFSAKVNTELDPALGETVMVPEDVARVISNLVMNACEAMVEKLRAEGDGYQPRLTVATKNSEDAVTMIIRDNGMGMNREMMARMFNPFVTTRSTGRNMGLGLSLVWDVIREHGGSVEPESEPGRYTEMKVQLPKRPAETG